MAENETTVVEVPIITVKEVLICHCGEPMTNSGFALMSNPPQYVHTCVNLHSTQPPHPNKVYPCIAYKDLQDMAGMVLMEEERPQSFEIPEVNLGPEDGG